MPAAPRRGRGVVDPFGADLGFEFGGVVFHGGIVVGGPDFFRE